MSSRRTFIQTAAGLFAAAKIATVSKIKGEAMNDVEFDKASQPGFEPTAFLLVPAKRFEDLKVGDIFRAPSRALTDAHAAAFQTVSADNHPVHYDAVWAACHGHSAPVVHGSRCSHLRLLEPRRFLTTSARSSSRLLNFRASS